MWQATVHRTPVQFDYSRAGQTRRHHPPPRSRGAWSPPRAAGTSPGSTPTAASRGCSGSAGSSPSVDPDGDAGLLHRARGHRPARPVRVAGAARSPTAAPSCWPAPGAANGLRRRAEVSATGVTGPDGTPGWDRLEVPYVSETDFAGELLGYADAVVVESPAELRAAVARRGSPASLARSGADERRPRAGLAPAGAGALPADAATDVSLAQVAADFGVAPDQIMKDLKVLWMCGLPGLTPDKMIDVDFEAIEDDPDGVVRIDNADFLSRPVRLGSSEASALIVALRALREGSPDASHEVIDRCLVKLEDAAASGTAAAAGRGAPAALGDRRSGTPRCCSEAIAHQPAGPARLLRADPRRDHPAHRRPAGAAHQRRPRLPRRLVPPRPGPAAVPARPDARRRGGRRAAPGARPDPARPLRGPVRARARRRRGRGAPRAARPLGRRLLPGGRGRGARRGPARGHACGSATRAGWCGWPCGWRPAVDRGGAGRAARRGRAHGAGDAGALRAVQRRPSPAVRLRTTA